VASKCHDCLVSEAGQRPPGGVGAIKVAIVDDDEDLRRRLTMLLTAEDDIEVAGQTGNTVTAIELAASAAPDVIVMDLWHAQGSGVQALVALKRVAPTAGIIMLSVGGEEADFHDAIRSGASGCLLNYTLIDEVAQAVRMVAGGRSLLLPSVAKKLIVEIRQITRPGEPYGLLMMTAREVEVVELAAEGLNERQIAQRLCISVNTVKGHVRNILEKLRWHFRMGQ
jgi:DNA-binding NarL/FixJ family response regulator